MHYLEIPEKNLTLYLPENLGECDAKQYAEMAKLIFSLQTASIPPLHCGKKRREVLLF